MKKLLFGLMTALVVFSACSKDDDNNAEESNLSQTSYVGTITVEEPYFVKNDATINVIPSTEKEGILDIEMLRARFNERMQNEVDLTIPGISYVKDGDKFILTVNDVDPTLKGNPFPKFHITNFNGTISGDDIEFTLYFGSYFTKYVGKVVKE